MQRNSFFRNLTPPLVVPCSAALVILNIEFLLEPGFLVQFDSTDRSTSRNAFLSKTKFHFRWLPRAPFTPITPPPPSSKFVELLLYSQSPKTAILLNYTQEKITTIIKQKGKRYLLGMNLLYFTNF